MPQPDVVGILQKVFVIRADIEDHRKADFRVDARTGGIQRKFTDRNAHSVRAEIAKAENAFAISNNDELRGERPIAEQLRNMTPVLCANEQSTGPLENVPEALTGEADGRRIDYGLDFVDVVDDYSKEERFVAIVQGIKRDIFLKVVRPIRRFVITRAACSSSVSTCAGSRPRNPNALRSLSLNAVPLFRSGSRRSATPRGSIEAAECVPRRAAMLMEFLPQSADVWRITAPFAGYLDHPTALD